MKLTEDLLAELRSAVAAAGGAGEFARRCGIDAANISRYLSGKVRSVSDDNWTKLAPRLGVRPFGHRSDTIANTAALRECIKDAMMNRRLNSAADLNRYIGYDSIHTLDRLLGGQLDWFPDVLSLVFDALDIDPDAAPLTPAERELLVPRGMIREGGQLVRPLPVVAWANAAGLLDLVISSGAPTLEHWDPDATDTVLSPVGGRKDTIAFRVAGVSMEPVIMDNDVILVEPVRAVDEVPENKIVVAKFTDCAQFPDGVVCKRFHRQPGGFLLTSDNPAGRIIAFKAGDLAWLGIVVRKITEM